MKKRPPDKIVAEDSALFRVAIGDVTPLPDHNRVKLHRAAHQPVLRAFQTTSPVPDSLSDVGAESAADEFLRNGVSRTTLRRLRRGHWPIQDSLDLHGSRSGAACQLLRRFLHDASHAGLRCILVIHGKGLNSPEGEPVLRKLARHWLAQHPNVLAFCDAQPKDGGSGAAIVLIRSKGD